MQVKVPFAGVTYYSRTGVAAAADAAETKPKKIKEVKGARER